MTISINNSRKQKLGVVLPLANEEDCIGELLDGIFVHLTRRDLVFCILDNACEDNTLAIVENYKQRNVQLRVVWAPENRCVVDAYFRGYREALKEDCDWILEMDGGMSHRPEQIPLFLSAMSKGYDFVAGSRFIVGSEYECSQFRYILSKGGTILTNLLLRTEMHDMTSGYECFTKEALMYVVNRNVRSKGHFFQTEIRYMLHTWRWKEIPISYTGTTGRVPSSAIFESFFILTALFINNIRKS